MNELKALIYATKTIDRRKREDFGAISAAVKDDIDDIVVTSVTVPDKVAGGILTLAMEGISELIMSSSLSDFDFSGIHAIMQRSGVIMIGMGEGEGPHRMEDAVWRAIHSPLIDIDISEATAALLNISGGPDLTLADAGRTAMHVAQLISPGADLFWGMQNYPDMKGLIRITLMLAGVRSPQICGKYE